MRSRVPPGMSSLVLGAFPVAMGRSRHNSGAVVAVAGGGGIVAVEGGGGMVAVAGGGGMVAVAGGGTAGAPLHAIRCRPRDKPMRRRV